MSKSSNLERLTALLVKFNVPHYRASPKLGAHTSMELFGGRIPVTNIHFVNVPITITPSILTRQESGDQVTWTDCAFQVTQFTFDGERFCTQSAHYQMVIRPFLGYDGSDFSQLEKLLAGATLRLHAGKPSEHYVDGCPLNDPDRWVEIRLNPGVRMG